MVRSPQLIVCAEVTAGSCAEVASRYRTARWSPACRSVDLGAAHRPLAGIGRSAPAGRPVRRPSPRSLQPTPVPWSRKFCRSNTNGAPSRSTTACSRHSANVYSRALRPITDDDLITAVVLSVNSQGGQRHWACRRDLHVGVGPARGGDADHPIDVAVTVAKLPGPQRGRAVAAVEIGDLPLRRAGRGRGAARSGSLPLPWPPVRCPPRRPTPTARPGTDAAFPELKSGRSGRRRIVRPAPRTPRGVRL